MGETNKNALLTIISSTNQSLSKLLGTSAGAVMRQAGIIASRELFPDLPSGLSMEEAMKVVIEGVESMKDFGDIKVSEAADDSVNINFHNCFFSTIIGESGLECGKQAFCFFGFGLVEETMRRITGRKIRVIFNSRDDENSKCNETISALS